MTSGGAAFVGCLAGNLRAASRVVSRRYDAALRGSGLRITQVAILAQVERREPVTVSDLAASLSCERSAMARDVGVLEGAGLLVCAVKRADRRARDIRLTPEGRRRLEECADAWRGAQASMQETLGAERMAELVRLASEVVDVLDT
jgi:DNA-binding MarR family transcriptional regulator